jgi:AcrR family transcriptional regulator
MAVAVSGRRGPVRPDSLHVLRGHETRRRILEGARQRILAQGFEALRLDDLAADAGITKAAVIKSVGGKASILLALGEEDRETRMQVVREALGQRTGLRRRLSETCGRLFAMDYPRIRLVQAYVGYLWFWSGEEHDRAQRNIDGMWKLLEELVGSAAPSLSAERARVLALRLMAGYVIGLRDLQYARSTIDEAVRTIIAFTLD